MRNELLLGLLVVWLGASGCSKPAEESPPAPPPAPPPAATAEDVKREAKEAWDTLGDFAAGKKDEAAATMDQKLVELKAELARLQEEAARAGGQVRTNTQALLAKAQEQLAAAEQKAKEFRNSQTNTWDSVKEGWSNTVTNLRQSLDKARQALE